MFFLPSAILLLLISLSSAAARLNLRPVGSVRLPRLFGAGKEVIASVDAPTATVWISHAVDKAVYMYMLEDILAPFPDLRVDRPSIDQLLQVVDSVAPRHRFSTAAWGNPQAVSVVAGVASVSIPNGFDKKGHVLLLDGTLAAKTQEASSVPWHAYPVGFSPDHATGSPNGKMIAVACQGAPTDSDDEKTYLDWPGSVTLVDISNGIGAGIVTDVDLTAFDGPLLPPASTYRPLASTPWSMDLEPEYLAWDTDSSRLFVSMQLSNLVGVLDAASKTFVSRTELGAVDWSKHKIDVSNKDSGIELRAHPGLFGLRQPDGVHTFRHPRTGRLLFLTADEGKDRELETYDGGVKRGNKLDLDPAVFGNAFEDEALMGRIKLIVGMGLDPGTGLYTTAYAMGSRGMSIFDATDNALTLVGDTFDIFETELARLLPQHFNSDEDEQPSFDSRSDDKGPEPEAVTAGIVDGRAYAFVALERMGGVMVVDIDDPAAPAFDSYANFRHYCTQNITQAFDLSPESVVFVEADKSPTGTPLVVVGNGVSASVTVYVAEQATGSDHETISECGSSYLPQNAPNITLATVVTNTVISSSGLSTGALIGICVGSGVALLIAVAVVLLAVRNAKKKHAFRFIDEDEVEIHEIIGRGSSGVVYRATYKGSQVAVKKLMGAAMLNAAAGVTGSAGTDSVFGGANSINMSKSLRLSEGKSKSAARGSRYNSAASTGKSQASFAGPGSKSFELFRQELSALVELRHPRTVFGFGGYVSRKDNCPCLVLEYIPTSLDTLLQNQTVPLPWTRRVQLARDIAEGLSFVHKNGLVHADVKSCNVLVDERAKVGDFGFTQSASIVNKNRGFYGTVRWAAPEVLTGGKHTAASDLYSLGVVLWEIASRAYPHEDLNAEQVRGRSDLGELRFDPKWGCPPEYVELSTQLMSRDPSARPALADVVTALGTMYVDPDAGVDDDLTGNSSHSLTVAQSVLGRETLAAMRAAMAAGTSPPPEHINDALVLFSDVVGFTMISSTIDPARVYAGLQRLFEKFDTLAAESGILPIETIGDAWLAAGGVCLGPDRERDRLDLCSAMARLGLAMSRAATDTLIDESDPSLGSFAIRVGIARGNVVGSMLGTGASAKFTLLGNTMNTASRMESTSPHGAVQLTPKAFHAVYDSGRNKWDSIANVSRRVVEAKGLGEIRTYVLVPRKTGVSEGPPTPGPEPATLPGSIATQ